MMKAVQATLLHCNSTNEKPRHHLCPEGPRSWCKWQVAQATGKVYNHKDPLPDAIVQLIRPIYSRLGSQSLLEKCVQGYTQNANEALHATIWKFCPKEIFMGKTGVEIACSLAVCCFNDGASSLATIAETLHLNPTALPKAYLKRKDTVRLTKYEYKATGEAKKLRRRSRRRRKGIADSNEQREGVMYAAGAFDAGVNQYLARELVNQDLARDLGVEISDICVFLPDFLVVFSISIPSPLLLPFPFSRNY